MFHPNTELQVRLYIIHMRLSSARCTIFSMTKTLNISLLAPSSVVFFLYEIHLGLYVFFPPLRNNHTEVTFFSTQKCPKFHHSVALNSNIHHKFMQGKLWHESKIMELRNCEKKNIWFHSPRSKSTSWNQNVSRKEHLRTQSGITDSLFSQKSLLMQHA